MIVPRSSLQSTGRRTDHVGASAASTVAALEDPVFVTNALADLLDQSRSSARPPLWVLPSISIGPRRAEVALEPTWAAVGSGDVVIDAVAVPPSDVDALLRLACTALPSAPGCDLTIAWRLRLWVPLPRAVVGAVGPALDASVERVVDRVFSRIVSRVESEAP